MFAGKTLERYVTLLACNFVCSCFAAWLRPFPCGEKKHGLPNAYTVYSVCVCIGRKHLVTSPCVIAYAAFAVRGIPTSPRESALNQTPILISRRIKKKSGSQKILSVKFWGDVLGTFLAVLSVSAVYGSASDVTELKKENALDFFFSCRNHTLLYKQGTHTGCDLFFFSQ